ncbi:hypothetical protein HELRODRAFT_184901 [Helobdella robusta]|uniref:ADP-ribosylhydrolase ARH1 n=1 Tax=Helobdella robusta TaxID=6412 RepID=T1FM53_HELRO|nr:hypothetical protein HELRODRAFT_184901 [Helobdella robusta]ESO05883.1 hypothetical protein HELRODRAFT_184901 [Helobdella robusta]
MFSKLIGNIFPTTKFYFKWPISFSTFMIFVIMILIIMFDSLKIVEGCSSRKVLEDTITERPGSKPTEQPKPAVEQPQCKPYTGDSINPVAGLTTNEWRTRYKMAMLLGGSADAIGYYRGRWEFQLKGQIIHDEVKAKGGIKSLNVSKPNWTLSDDTIMHLATGEAITEYIKTSANDLEKLYITIAKHYIKCMLDMVDRAPGTTTMKTVAMLDANDPKGYIIPFDDRGGGCGGAMRSMCIGLLYPDPKQLDLLIAVSIESGRMTHNHPTGFLGSLTSALFTHYAIQGKPVHMWGAGLMETLDKAWQYVNKVGRDVEKNKGAWSYFRDSWSRYLKIRCLEGGTQPLFPSPYGVRERDKFYKEISFDGWGGASGHDAPMIAYDAFVGAGNSWEELANRAFFHGGDSDSTAIIAATWFAISYGHKDVPVNNYQYLEYRDRLETVGEEIFNYVEKYFNEPKM